MAIWQIWAVTGIVLLIVEMLTPTMFFLNLALACIPAAIVGVYSDNWTVLILVWAAVSGLLLAVLRPLLERKNVNAVEPGGMSQYIGRKVKVVETVTGDSGVISVFDERWNARSADGEEIAAGTTAVIVRNDDLTMYVKKED